MHSASLLGLSAKTCFSTLGKGQLDPRIHFRRCADLLQPYMVYCSRHCVEPLPHCLHKTQMGLGHFRATIQPSTQSDVAISIHK